jgi:hypothetical protein
LLFLFFLFLFFFTSTIQIIIFKNKSKTTTNNPDLQNSQKLQGNPSAQELEAGTAGSACSNAPPSLAARGFTRCQESSRPKLASSPLLFCNGGDTHRHLQNKKTQNTTTSRPFSSRFFFHLHPTDPVFWTLISTLFQVAGKEEDTDQRGVTAGGVRSDCGYCCCRWGLFGRW